MGKEQKQEKELPYIPIEKPSEIKPKMWLYYYKYYQSNRFF